MVEIGYDNFAAERMSGCLEKGFCNNQTLVRDPGLNPVRLKQTQAGAGPGRFAQGDLVFLFFPGY